MRRVGLMSFVGFSILAMYAVPSDWVDSHDTAWTLAWIGVYVVSGGLIGRWWALPLAFLPVLLAVPQGDQGDIDGVELWQWALLDTVLFFAWIMLVGVLAGWGIRVALRHARQRRAASAL